MTKSVKSTRATTPMYGDQTYVLTYLGEDNRSYVVEKGLFNEVSVSDLQELRAFMGEERGRYLSKVLNMSDSPHFYYFTTEEYKSVEHKRPTIVKATIKDLAGNVLSYIKGTSSEKYGKVNSIQRQGNELIIEFENTVKHHVFSEAEFDEFISF
jgi:hypothetical protein